MPERVVIGHNVFGQTVMVNSDAAKCRIDIPVATSTLARCRESKQTMTPNKPYADGRALALGYGPPRSTGLLGSAHCR